jgi:ribosomal protein S5
VGKKDKTSAIRKRVNNAKKYLTKTFRFESKRIIIVELGKSEEAKFILQPVDKGSPSPFP